MKRSEIIASKFNYLVNNALDFLKASISELKGKPKYSVIHFHAAIELFLKARLMDEHWSLVIAYNKEPDWNKFQNGDFVSVTLDEASKKLSKVVQSGLNDKALTAFHNITRHRNQMVHFYHEADTPEKRKQEIQKVVKEQLRAWYFLNDLLLRQWKEVFSAYEEEIIQIGNKLKKNNTFLKIKYEEIKPNITELKNQNFIFLDCASCGFCAVKHASIKDTIYESHCLVCDFKENCIAIDCATCSKGKTLFQGYSTAECDSCGYLAIGVDLKNKFVDENANYIAIKEGIYSCFPIGCGVCSETDSVIEVPNDKLLCSNCFDVAESYGSCEWCNTDSTYMQDDSYVFGCEFCEGRMGWDKYD